MERLELGNLPPAWRDIVAQEYRAVCTAPWTDDQCNMGFQIIKTSFRNFLMKMLSVADGDPLLDQVSGLVTLE